MDTVVSQARQMRVKFLEQCEYKIPLRINVGKFARVVSEQTGIEITSVELPDMGSLRGMLYRPSEKKAVVLISNSEPNNECWKRFTFIKEISHLFLEDKNNFNKDAYLQAICLVDDDMRDSPHFQHELNGIISAIEIMIPDTMLGTIEHLARVKKLDAYSIAEMFMVPLKFLEYKMRKNDIPILTKE